MNLSRELRNQQFAEKFELIDKVIRRHYRLIQACRMSVEDLRQDLSVRMLKDLERYQALLCPNLDAYLWQRMGFEILHLAMPAKRYGIPGAPPHRLFCVLSLDAANENGQTLAVPCQDESLAVLWLQHEIAALPDKQRIVMNRLLSGEQIRSGNKALKAARRRIKARMNEVGIFSPK